MKGKFRLRTLYLFDVHVRADKSKGKLRLRTLYLFDVHVNSVDSGDDRDQSEDGQSSLGVPDSPADSDEIEVL